MLIEHLFAGRKINALGLTLVVSTIVLAGCAEIGPGGAEAKLGVGPFKLYSVEAGPGGTEAKGLSAGPFKARE